MVEGESGLLAVFPSDQRPIYEPSKRRITFHNGAVATIFSSEEPDRLRGPQCEAFWAEELAHWTYQQETWDNLMFGWRLGDNPRGVVTSTPRPTAVVRDLVRRASESSADVHITTESTYANVANLAPAFAQQIIRRYEGTRLGRQEIYGELLEDVPGALWTLARLDALRVDPGDVPDLVRVVVGVDPSGGSDEGHAETGIVIVGKGTDDELYVLGDASVRGTPLEWAAVVCEAYGVHKADLIVAENNYGGEMVESTIRSIPEGRTISYQNVVATRGKAIRAEPISALYEQGRAHHVGTFTELEDQMCNWIPEDKVSPDRMDALVWAATELMDTPGQGVW
jgi:phage terminase large subunit-like protein